MDEREVRRIVSEAVQETLTRIGIEADNPLEAQKDQAFVRNLRTSTETVKRQGIIAAVGIITAGFLGAIWMSLKGTGTN